MVLPSSGSGRPPRLKAAITLRRPALPIGIADAFSNSASRSGQYRRKAISSWLSFSLAVPSRSLISPTSRRISASDVLAMAAKDFVPFFDAATDEFYTDLRKLLELTPEQIAAIATRFNSDEGFHD